MENSFDNGPCPVCGRWKNRVMTVDAVVFREGKILLIQRKNEPYRYFWALPGGYMDYNETAEQAALRELLEETGLSADKGTFLGVYSTPERHPDQVVSAVFVISDWSGTPHAGDDAGALQWFPPENLPPNLAFDHRIIIKDAINTL